MEFELDIEDWQKLEIIMAKCGFKSIQQCVEALIKEAYASLRSR